MENRWIVVKKFQSEEYRCENDEDYKISQSEKRRCKNDETMGKFSLRRGDVKTMRLWENLV